MPKQITEKLTRVFGKGTINTIESELISPSAISESENFITYLDRMELTRGRKLLGAEETGSTPVLGLTKVIKQDGLEILIRKAETKLQYYDSANDLWVDMKTGLDPSAEIYFDMSFTPAGRQLWCCSRDGLYKVYPSALTDVLDMTSVRNYKGKIKIEKSRMWCYGMEDDPTGLRASKVDRDSNYTLVSAEAIGASGSVTYTGTLAHGQVFGVVFTSGSQIVYDDKNGLLVGDGTGTINYATGQYSVTFTTSTAAAVTCKYLWEDPTTGGLADFRYSATRLAGEGNILRQDSTGTKSMVFVTFNSKYYTLQDNGSWELSVSSTDLDWNNQVYNTTIGTPNSSSAIPVADGIVFIDTSDPEKPKLRKLRYNEIGDRVIPEDLSQNFKMEDYVYDKSVVFSFGDYYLISCRTSDSSTNNFTLIYNYVLKTFDTLTNGYSYFVEANNKLYGGDSSSSNVYEILSGYDDLEYTIEGFFVTKNDDYRDEFSKNSEQLKKFKEITIAGYIGESQSFELYASFDREDFVLLGSFNASTDLSDTALTRTVGESLLGDIVGGGDTEVTDAFYYRKTFRYLTQKFYRRRLKIVPTGIGYFSVTEFKDSKIKFKGFKTLTKYK